MKYVCHRSFRGKGASGKKYFIKKNKELEVAGNFITRDVEAICYTTSQVAYEHFARNDDGRGLERGDLTYRIAFSDRHPNEDNGFRFTPEEIEMLETEYDYFLLKGPDSILFNFEFFNADIDKLQELADRLEV